MDMNQHPGGPAFHQPGLFQREESFQTSSRTVQSLNVRGSPWETTASLLLSIIGSVLETVAIQKPYPLLQHSFFALDPTNI
jgi:hypothetical protein